MVFMNPLSRKFKKTEKNAQIKEIRKIPIQKTRILAKT
tara:strand:+ start:31550 stop:31663 length:114 start_codon:yes stop_codon:yes gene_type:complete